MTDNDDRQKIYTEADNITIMIGTDINEAIKEFFQSLLKKYRESIQTMKLSIMFLIALINFAANCGSDLPILEWMKHKKATTNIQNDDNKCFQYSL